MKFISVLQVVVLSAFVIISSKARNIKLQKCMAVYDPQYRNELNAKTNTTCSSSATSYYYDARTDECKTYPGCGNGNAEITFSSKQDCERICKSVCGPDDVVRKGEYRIERNCDPYFRYYVYDENSNKCEHYFACAGERQVFIDKSLCEKSCVIATSRTTLRPNPTSTSDSAIYFPDSQFPSKTTLRPKPTATSDSGIYFPDSQFPSKTTLRPKPTATSDSGIYFPDSQFPSRTTLKPKPRPTLYPGIFFPDSIFPSRTTLRPKPRPTSYPGIFFPDSQFPDIFFQDMKR